MTLEKQLTVENASNRYLRFKKLKDFGLLKDLGRIISFLHIGQENSMVM
jgi:hypothetical protein